MDTHRPALLNDPLYFADGQIREEVYVYGSFLQSRMYQAGVTCSDCHNPHSLQLVTGGEPSDVCAQCHLPTKFDAPEHHQHAQDQVACVDCHMPSRVYMGVDARRDHSMRIPRPELSLDGETPNACENCHSDQGTEWLVTKAGEWWGAAEERNEDMMPGIVRATLLTMLSPPLSQQGIAAIEDGARNADPLVRMAALQSARALPPQQQLQLGAPPALDLKQSVCSHRIVSICRSQRTPRSLPRPMSFVRRNVQLRACPKHLLRCPSSRQIWATSTRRLSTPGKRCEWSPISQR
jgi:hypothetical protein